MTMLGAGDIIERSGQFYRVHATTVFRANGLNIAAGLALAGVETLLLWLYPSGSKTATALIIAASLPAIAVSAFTTILLVRIMAMAIRNPEGKPAVSWRDAWKSFWPAAAAIAGSSLLIFLGSVAFVIPALIFWVWFVFAPISTILGDAPWRKSFARSRELSRGHFFPVLWRLAAPTLFFALFQLVLILLTALLLQGAVRGIWSIELLVPGAPLWFLLTTNGIMELLRSVLAPLFIFPVTLLYLALKHAPADTAPNA